MRDFDVYEDGKLVQESEELSRQSLEHWVKTGSEIGDAKFKFIDWYLQKSLIEKVPEFENATDKIIEFREMFKNRLFVIYTLEIGEFLNLKYKKLPTNSQENFSYQGW